ncbi:hypothetical protein [Pseudomonas nicosulfuronedens]
MPEEIEFVREQAKRGHSFSHTASLLGFYPYQLRTLLEAVGADDIQFVNGHQSIVRKKMLAELHESRRGHTKQPTAAELDALAKGRKKVRERFLHAAFGVTGTIRELKDYFGCQLTLQCLRTRLRKGMSAEEALTKPAAPHPPKGVIPPHLAKWVLFHQQRKRALCAEAIKRRLTPTMLQLCGSQHDIRVTRRDAGRISVEVRTLAGELLHSLRFYVSFDSGVLFAFNLVERGRIDFIAFDPSNKALTQSDA